MKAIQKENVRWKKSGVGMVGTWKKETREGQDAK